MKKQLKDFLTNNIKQAALALVACGLLISVPIAAFAAVGLSVDGLSFSSDWTAEGENGATKTVETEANCDADAVTSTLTITCTDEAGGVLSFDVSSSGDVDSCTVAGPKDYSSTDAGRKTINLSYEEQVTITIKSKTGKSKSATATVSNISFLKAETVAVNFLPDPQGIITYTANGQTVGTNGYNLSATTGSNVSYEITASTNAKYLLAGWHWTDGVNEGYYSVGQTAVRNVGDTGNIYVEGPYTLTPVVAYYNNGESAPLRANGEYWWTWETAFHAAAQGDKKVVQTANFGLSDSASGNGMVKNGKPVNGTYVTFASNGKSPVYTIPFDFTFLAPRMADQERINDVSHNLPYSNYTEYKADSRWNVSTSTKRYLLFTVPSGTTVNNNGHMIFGGSIASMDHYFGGATLSSNSDKNGTISGHTHSDMTLNGTLNMGSNSVLSAIGYVTGSGTINADGEGVTGAKIYQPFVINDAGGGNYYSATVGKTDSVNVVLATKSGEEKIAPFLRYTMFNIRAKMKIGSGNYMYGYVNLYAGGQINSKTIAVVGDSNDKGLLNLDSNGTVEITYDANTTVQHLDTFKYNKSSDYSATNYYEATSKTGTWFSDGVGTRHVGRTTWKVEGGADFGAISITAKLPTGLNWVGGATNGDITMNMAEVTFPLPYNFKIELNASSSGEGNYTIGNSMMLLPGSEVTVGSGAVLSIDDSTNDGIRFMVMDGLFDHSTIGDSKNARGSQYLGSIYYGYYPDFTYPKTGELQIAGLPGTACLTLDGGKLIVNEGVSFGGLVQTTGKAGSVVEFYGTPSCTTQIGTVGTTTVNYYFAGATVRTLAARLMTGAGEYEEMVSGKIYKGQTDDNNYIESYEYTVYDNSENTASTIDRTGESKDKATDALRGVDMTQYKLTKSPYYTNNLGELGCTCTTVAVNGVDYGNGAANGHWCNYFAPMSVSGMWYDYTLTVKEDGKADVVYYHLNDKLYNAEGEVTAHTIPDGANAEITSGSGVTLATVGDTLTFSDVALTEDTVVTVSVACEHEGAVETEEIPATCEGPGTKAYWTCDACGKSFADENFETEIGALDAWLTDENGGLIPAKGHNYGEPTFNWADDNSCTATFTCANGCEGLTVDCTVTVGQTVDTDTLEVTETVTAAVSVEDATYEDTKTSTFAAVARVDWATEGVADTYYANLQSAIDAAINAGDTVVVLSDLTLDAAITVAENQNITLDLNGKTITNATATTLINEGILNLVGTAGETIGSGGAIICDASGTKNGADTFVAAVKNTGTLTVSNISIESGEASEKSLCGLLNLSGGTINSIDNVRITVSSSINSHFGIYNYGTIEEIGTTDITGYYGIYAIGESSLITTIGTSGSTVSITAGNVAVYANANSEITTVGGFGSAVIINSGNYGIYAKGSTSTPAKIVTIGAAGSTVNISSSKYGIYANQYCEITTIGNKSTAEGQYTVSVTSSNVGIYTVADEAKIANIGSVDIDATNYGIYSKVEITNIGMKDCSTSVKAKYAICAQAGGSIKNVGALDGDVFVEPTSYGIYASGGSISTIGQGLVEIVGPGPIRIDDYTDSSTETTYEGVVGEICDGVIAICTGDSSYSLNVRPNGTLTLLSGGYFCNTENEVRSRAVYLPDAQNYRDGYTLSAEGKTIPVKLSNGTIKNCYYITAKTPTAGTVTGGETTDVEKEYASLMDAIAAYQSMSAADKKNSYVVLYESTTETADITLSEDLYLDLNGKTVDLGSYVLDLGEYTLYGMDSRTNAYSDEDAGAISGTISGKVAPVTEPTGRGANGGKTYVTVVTTDDNGGISTSFHRVAAHVTGIQLAVVPNTNDGYLTFRGTFRGDDLAAEKLTNVGFMFNDNEQNATWFGSPADGEENNGEITKADKAHFYYTRKLKNIDDIAQAAALMQLEGIDDSLAGKSVDVSGLLLELKGKIGEATDWTEAQKSAFTKYLSGLNS